MRTPASVSIPLPRISPKIFVLYTGLVVFVALCFGGGGRAGQWSNVLPQLAALPLLVAATLKLVPARLQGLNRWAMILLGSMIALPLVQLIPLPPSLWSALPGRSIISASYRAAGLSLPWLPLSLDPAATWRSLLTLLPPVAVFLAVLALERPARRGIVALMLVVAAASVLLELLQMAGGTESPLRFYRDYL